MSERELVVGLNELNRLELDCPKCGTGTVFDVSGGAHISSACPNPACRNDLMSEDLRKAILAYQQLFSAAKDDKVNIKFRIRES